MAGVNEAGGSRTASMAWRNDDPRLNALGAPIRTPEHEKAAASEGVPFWSFESMFTIPIVIITLGVALVAAEAFGPLTAILNVVSTIYGSCEVRR